MSCLGFVAGHPVLHRLDPRVRLLTAVGLSVIVALADRLAVMGWAFALAALLTAAARLDGRKLARRLLHLNAFLLFLWAVLPWSVPGAPLGAIGGVPLTQAGVRLAMAITLKGHAIVLLITVLVATLDPHRLSCALKRMGLPDKLVHLFALTIRFTDVIHEAYGRLRLAMRARAFQPRFSLHTLRTIGYLVGLLLVRGIERGERVLVAMKCRAFDGRYHALEECSPGYADAMLAVVALVHAALWIWMEHA